LYRRLQLIDHLAPWLLLVAFCVNSNAETRHHPAIPDSSNRPIVDSNPSYTRYFFVPNAMPLDKKAGYLQTTWLAGWSANYGISRHASLGFLTTVLGQPFLLTPKFGTKISESWHIGSGLIIGKINETFGVAYGMSTWGDSERNVSWAMGWGFADGKIMRWPAVSVAAMRRVSPNLLLMAESWAVTNYIEDAHLLIYGLRWHLSVTSSLDIGFVLHRETIEEIKNNPNPGFPFLGWTYRFQ